jgi:hypothetical protein
LRRVREAAAESDAVFQPHLVAPEEFVACTVRALPEVRAAAAADPRHEIDEGSVG